MASTPDHLKGFAIRALKKKIQTLEALVEIKDNALEIAYDGITTGFHGMSQTKTAKLIRHAKETQ